MNRIDRIAASVLLLLLTACARPTESADPPADLPPDPDYLVAMQEVRALYARGAFEETLEVGRRALHQAPNQPDAYTVLSRVYTQTGRDEEAQRFFEALVVQYPDVAHGAYAAGNHAFRLHDWVAARDHYARAAELAPDDPAPRFNLGTVLHHLGEFEAAEAAYRAAHERAPGRSPISAQLARALRILGRYDEAEAVVDDALLASPDAAELHQARARLWLREGETEAAETAFRRALALDPRLGEARADLAGLLERSGRLEQARLMAAQADRLRDADRYRSFLQDRLRLTPSAALLPLMLAELEITESDPGAATRWLNRATALGAPGDRLAAVRIRIALSSGSADPGALARLADPGPPQVELARAALAIAAGDAPAGQERLDRVAADGGADKTTLHAVADLYGAAGAPEREFESLLAAAEASFAPAPSIPEQR